MRSKILLPFCLVGIALVLRLRDLSDVSFWFDELWTASLWAHPNSLTTVWQRLWMPVEGNLPLYPIFINIWSALFGNQELTLIVPSVLTGTACVGVIYTLGEKLFSRFEGIVAASLMATLSTPLYFSQEARGYSFILLFVCLNLLYRYTNKNIGWAITSILLCWIHYFGIFFVFIQIIPDLFKRRSFLKMYLIPLVSLIPIMNLIFFQISHGPTFTDDDYFPYFSEWIFNSESKVLVYGLGGLLTLQSLMTLFSKEKIKGILGELVLYVYAPFIFLFAYNHLIRPIYSERYFITLIPPALLLIAVLIKNLKILAPVVIVLSLWSSLSVDIRQTDEYPRYKEALAFINNNKLGTHMLYFPEHQRDLIDYYLKRFKNIKTLSHMHEEEKFWYLDLAAFPDELPYGLTVQTGFDYRPYDIRSARIYLLHKTK